MITIITEMDLCGHTEHVMAQARQGQTLIVANDGEEQVAILDILNYRLLKAVATYHTQPPSSTAPIYDETVLPHGLTETTVEKAVIETGGDVQAAWNCIIAAYLNGHISLGRAAQMLHLSRFVLIDRFNQLSIPLLLGPATLEGAKAELLQALNP